MNAFGPQAGTAAAWQQELVLALRMRDVPGRRIGEVLAEVEAHCADSGQSPVEAFGDAEAYAEQVTPAGQPLPVRSWLLPAVATPVGVVALLEGADAVAHGGTVPVTVGLLLSLVVTVAMIAGVVLRLSDVLRSPWRSWLAISAAFATAAVLPAVLPAVLVALPPRPVLVAGILLLGAAWCRPGGAGGAADLVVDPRTGDPVVRGAVLLMRVLRWALPAVLLVALVLVVVFPA